MVNNISYYILSAVAVLITLTVHEYCHGYAAYKLGDPTAKSLGRLTLNPIKHIDPFGAICMILFRFGWAKPVPINPRYFKKPKRDIAITSLAGPLSNLVMAFISGLLYLLIYAGVKDVAFSSRLLFNLVKNTLDFILILHAVNIGITVFNLIPLPPLDGSKILGALLPTRAYIAFMRNERRIYWILLGWLLLGDFAARTLLSIPFIASTPPLAAIAEIFSLSGLIGRLIDLISNLILSFWQLIPYLKI